MHAVLRVHDQQADVRPLHRPRRAQRGVELEILLDLAALAQTRGVDEDEASPLEIERRIDRVARRSRLGGDDQSILAEQPIDEA